MGAAGLRAAEEVREAVRAGAEFVLTASTDLEVIRACQDAHTLAIPGALTPTEIGQAWSLRTGLVAIFPAGRVGPDYLRDLLRTMPEVAAVATGGITPENAGRFIRAGAAAVVAMEEPDAPGGRDYDAMTRRAQALVATVERARAQSAWPTPPVRPTEGPDIK
ncbi:MAG TPA: bifunctional 4-hydroxy-2-oxoglutarate aldolase/2-dehydro-3-deoxy-phosphogluconate aldolase [Candidatus Methylomirabilis sp.]|nr:bifunctional 4-hydroxy-2-oxoglutarate aldolase/2-dehydro-3-deoxy-phosphogluconate aldolase [Candidatus Methylomirabilis sp.]